VNVLQWARGQWDRVSAWILISLGALAVVLGWLGVRTEALTQKQIPYIISGGIGGLLLVAVGAMLWLSADLCDEWRKLDAIERAAIAAPRLVEPDPFIGEPAGAPAPRPAAARSRKPRTTPPS
jgi:hypothetical protein